MRRSTTWWWEQGGGRGGGQRGGRTGRTGGQALPLPLLVMLSLLHTLPISVHREGDFTTREQNNVEGCVSVWTPAWVKAGLEEGRVQSQHPSHTAREGGQSQHPSHTVRGGAVTTPITHSEGRVQSQHPSHTVRGGPVTTPITHSEGGVQSQHPSHTVRGGSSHNTHHTQ